MILREKHFVLKSGRWCVRARTCTCMYVCVHVCVSRGRLVKKDPEMCLTVMAGTKNFEIDLGGSF